MSLANGRSHLAIPGPSIMPDRVLQAMHQPAPNIYEGALVELTAGLVPDLKWVAGTEHHVAMYICNGHGVWEAALANTVAPGEKVLVPSCGRFGHGWAEFATRMGIEVELIDFGKRAPMDLEVVGRALEADKDHKIKAVLATHVDTSSSVLNDIPALRKLMDDLGHPAMLWADCVASMGCDRFEMDAWGVDLAITASQKGLMTPPGMAFIFFSPKAQAAREGMKMVSPHWDWSARAFPEMFYEFFGGTAPTHHLFALREALNMMREEGLEAIWKRHDVLARALWAAADVWGQDGPMELNIADPACRSRAVTSLRLGSPNATALRDWVSANASVTLGIGLGMVEMGDPAWHGFFRVGHMGHLNAHGMMGVIGVMEAGLQALQIPHGGGAVAAAAGIIAKG